jgi:hypothetical protein
MKIIGKIALLLLVMLLAAQGSCRNEPSDEEPVNDDEPVLHDDVIFAFGSWRDSGNMEACLKEFDKDGAEDAADWDKLMGDGTVYCESNVMDIDSENNVYVAYDRYSVTTHYDWRIRKFNSSGIEDTVNWNKTFDGSMNNGPDVPIAMLVDGNDDVYVVDCRDGSDMSQYNWRIKKYSADGTEITAGWNKVVTGTDAVSSDLPSAAVADSNGNLYIAGYLDNVSGYILAIKKYSSAGVEDTTNWDKSFAVPAVVNTIQCLAVDSNDNLYVGGNAGDNLLIKKYSSAGVEDTANWNKSIDIDLADTVQAMAVDSDGNLYTANTYTTGSQSDWCIKKFSSAGTEITTGWNKQFDSGGEDHLSSIAVGGQDDVYIFGLTPDGATGYNWSIRKYASDGTEDTVNWNKAIAANAVNPDSGVTILVDYLDY